MHARRRTPILFTAAALVALAPGPASAGGPDDSDPPELLTSGLEGGSGSAIGPDGALYVTEGIAGRVSRVDLETGDTTVVADCLPGRAVEGIGGAIDVAFLHDTVYVLVTVVGVEVGGEAAVVGIYRVDDPDTCTPVADIGAWSVAHPPATDFFVPTGVQYAMEPYHGGFLVTDGHHNRLLQVTVDGEVSEVLTLPNVVPTGLERHDGTVYVALAGPVPHLPEDGRIISLRAGSPEPSEVASGGRLLVDVERGSHGGLFALAQGIFLEGSPEGSPATPDTGQLLKVDGHGGFDVVTDRLDRPTSLEIVGDTAYVVTLAGDVWEIDDVDDSDDSDDDEDDEDDEDDDRVA